MQVTQALNWSVRQATELEANLVAVERLRTYVDVPAEPGYGNPSLHEPSSHDVGGSAGGAGGAGADAGTFLANDGSMTMQMADEAAIPADAPPASQPSRRPSGFWGSMGWGAPSAPEPPLGDSGVRGLIELRGVGMRYREDLPPVLDGLSLTIQPAQKIGIVGRTGSGKSSLLMALTRLVAPPLRTGQIFLDGQDIASLPLLPYRSAICVIPQDPTLFTGSVRFNLDPLGVHADMDLLQVLQRVQLAHAVGSLDDAVLEDGANLSAGQRQLLCIARALLAKPHVLIMDEATSAVDAETDAFIQRVVRSEFRDATVITIAHRLNTILDTDKVLVLHEGKLAEFDSPKALMARRDGHFRQMVSAASHL